MESIMLKVHNSGINTFRVIPFFDFFLVWSITKNVLQGFGEEIGIIQIK